MRCAFLVLLLVGCASNSEPTPAPAPGPTESNPPAQKPADPPAESTTPDPGTTMTSAPVVGGDLTNCGDARQVDVSSAGVSFTVSVDTHTMQRAHLGAGARALVDESPSSFTVELAENGTKLKDGWDVCVGQTDTSCFANLEMDPGIGVRTFTLTVHTKAASATAIKANVSVCVIDPLE